LPPDLKAFASRAVDHLELSEWFKEHTWKLIPLARADT
jgi:hypothetical protein